MKLVILSCDKYSEYWKPFFILLDRYYSNHPQCCLVTETKKCPYCHTININSQVWTERFREALKQIEDNEVLIMLEDFFIRQPVDEEKIKEAINILQTNSNIAVCNFEPQYRQALPSSFPHFDQQINNQMYLNSCQPSLWNRKILIDRLSKQQNPWEWETTIINSPYIHLINNSSQYIIDIGYKHQSLEEGWGVTRGKLTQECIDFFNKENINLNNHIEDKKLSIITPYHNVLKYTQKLAAVLEPQLTNEVEWIIIDDGCQEKELNKLKAKVIHLNQNCGAPSIPRNIGLDNAQGKFIAFIDADDLVYDNYIEKILNKINNEDFDYCFLSWKSPTLDIIIEDFPPDWNFCVWNCIYKKSIIGEERFNPDLIIWEDGEFNNRVRKGKKSNITEVLYYYNDTPNSLMKRSAN